VLRPCCRTRVGGTNPTQNRQSHIYTQYIYIYIYIYIYVAMRAWLWTSGAIYSGVPQTVNVLPMRTLAMAKSYLDPTPTWRTTNTKMLVTCYALDEHTVVNSLQSARYCLLMKECPGPLNPIFRSRSGPPDLGNAILALFGPLRIDLEQVSTQTIDSG